MSIHLGRLNKVMNLKLIFRIYAGVQIASVLGGIFSPEAMMKAVGMTFSPELSTIMRFSILGQIIIIAITLQLPNWLGDNLAKAGFTYVGISILPILLNTYHVVTEVLPVSPAFFIENALWVVFAALFFMYSKKS